MAQWFGSLLDWGCAALLSALASQVQATCSVSSPAHHSQRPSLWLLCPGPKRANQDSLFFAASAASPQKGRQRGCIIGFLYEMCCPFLTLHSLPSQLCTKAHRTIELEMDIAQFNKFRQEESKPRGFDLLDPVPELTRGKVGYKTGSMSPPYRVNVLPIEA